MGGGPTMKLDVTNLIDILDHAREIIYVIDVDTYELLYVNRRAREWKGNRALAGRPCYKAMNRLEERCPWCFIPKMRDGQIHFEDVRVPGMSMWLQIDAYEVDWQGHRAAFIYSIDITDQKQRQQMYEAAVDEAHLAIWEYDISSHRVTMSENEFTRYDYRKFSLPRVIEDAPASLVPYIDDAYVDSFLGMYAQVEAGAPRASCEVWYKLKPDRTPFEHHYMTSSR